MILKYAIRIGYALLFVSLIMPYISNNAQMFMPSGSYHAWVGIWITSYVILTVCSVVFDGDEF